MKTLRINFDAINFDEGVNVVEIEYDENTHNGKELIINDSPIFTDYRKVASKPMGELINNAYEKGVKEGKLEFLSKLENHFQDKPHVFEKLLDILMK